MKISIIIPTLNEETHIDDLLQSLALSQEELEVIVVDGGSTDCTISVIERFPDVKLVHSKVTSRASQMNLGASIASGEVLYFVHADVRLPSGFQGDITRAISDGYDAGCYRFRFLEKPYKLLCVNDFFTRFPFRWCRGGDQTLFITKRLFSEVGGFDEKFVIMEDYDLLDRLSKRCSFVILPKSVGVSARKYLHNSYLKVQLTNFKAMRMYRRGIDPSIIKSFYQQALV